MLFCPKCDWNNSEYPEASYCPEGHGELVEVSLVVEPERIVFKDIYFGEHSPQKVRISISRSDGKEIKASGHIKNEYKETFDVKQISDIEIFLICHPKDLKQKHTSCELEITDELTPLRKSIPVKVELITSKIEAAVLSPSRQNFISVSIKNVGQEDLKLHSFSFKSKPSKAIRPKPNLLKPEKDERFHVRIPANPLQRFVLGKKEAEDILVIHSNDAEQPEFELQSSILVKPWLNVRKILLFLIVLSVPFLIYLLFTYVRPIERSRDIPPPPILLLNSSESGRVNHALKENWWELKIPSEQKVTKGKLVKLTPGELTVELTCSPPTGNLDVAFYDSQRKRILAGPTNSSKIPKKLSVKLSSGGSYYIRVYTTSSAAALDYTLSNTFATEPYLQGIKNYEEQKWKKCRANLEEALSLPIAKTDELQARLFLGVAYVAYEMREKAKEQFKKLLEIKPDYTMRQKNFSTTVREVFDEARRELQSE